LKLADFNGLFFIF